MNQDLPKDIKGQVHNECLGKRFLNEHAIPTKCITDLDKLILAWWVGLRLEPIFANDTTGRKIVSHYEHITFCASFAICTNDYEFYWCPLELSISQVFHVALKFTYCIVYLRLVGTIWSHI